MRILVTGGAGFIGSSIVDAYVDLGHHVHVLDNLSTGRRSNLNRKALFTRVDISDSAAIKRIFSRNHYDIVNHHAAQMNVRKSVENPQFDANVNIMGLLNILTAARQKKIKKFIFSSSGGAVYGECLRAAVEGTPEKPLSPYGIAKLASEKYIQAFAQMYGMDYLIFRYSNVYGPRQDPHGEAGVVAIFANLLLKNKRPAIYGSGHQTRDFVHVQDVVRANVLGLKTGHRDIINIGTGIPTSIAQLYRVMADLETFKLKPLKLPARLGELNKSLLNINRARKKLGWLPQIALRTGLADTIASFQ